MKDYFVFLTSGKFWKRLYLHSAALLKEHCESCPSWAEIPLSVYREDLIDASS